MSDRSPVELLLLVLGALALLRALAALAVALFRRVLAPGASYARFAGQWAVVTGASAGIGAAFARGLAARGLHVVLIARSKSKLEDVARQCAAAGAKEKANVQTRVIAFDFAAAGPEDYARLQKELASLEPAILVNNVGMNVPYPQNFVETDEALVESIVKVNIGATNKMTRMLLPSMVEKKQGAVFCLSSAGGAISPAPLLAAYAGTKAYMDAFAIALSGETRDANVQVHSLTPFFVATEMAKMRRSFTVPTAQQFAEQALDGLGGPVRANPHWPHVVMASALLLLPLKAQIIYVTNLHRDIQKRAVRRAQRLAAAAKSE